ncbi:hypothetical protein WJX72_002264 [[Myrmecia] bisecta]|uniref:Heme O synthase n=1 Tax=[Myrmecia] bisecta TaxID=41462 RepID=A0AAW1QPF5_9CHLO
MGVGGVSILAVKTNNLTAGLGAANIGLYAAVYTPLKVVSIANTWVGAVVGAIPPLMGWAAAAGQLDAGAGVLAAALYFWQLPHFLALAWLCRADYARGGYRMLSLVDPTGRRTAACALRNCIYLLPLGAVAVWAGVATPAFGYEAALVTGGMTVAAAAFYQAPSSPAARTLFRASLLHLPLFMGGLVLHRVPNTQEHKSQQQLFARLHLKLTGSDLSVTSNLRERWQRASPPAHTALHAASIAPFPFLPVPFEWRCPSKAACQSLEEEESADSKDAGEAEQISH